MRFTIAKEELLKGLLTAGHAANANAVNPTLSCLKLEVTSKGLEITSSNGNISIWTLIPEYRGDQQVVRNSALGAALINARIITEFAKRLSGDEVSVEIIDNALAKIDDGRTSLKLNCMDADEYPDINFEKAGNSFIISCEALSKMTAQTAFAASDKNRPVLGAVNLKAEAGRLVATATDSARLSRKSIEVDPDLRFSANIPAKTLSDIVKMFDGVDEVEMSTSREKITFTFGTTIVTSRLLSDDYPVSNSIVPQIFNYYLEIDSQQLLNAIDRVSILSTDKASVVKLSMTSDDVEISSSSDQNGSGVEKLPVLQFNGERLDIAFNASFVSQAVRALGCQSVVFSFVGEMRPFVIKNPEDDSVVELITPMRMR